MLLSKKPGLQREYAIRTTKAPDIVGGKDQRRLPLFTRLREQAHHFPSILFVQVSSGLICQYKLWMIDQSACDRYALLFSAAEFSRTVQSSIAQANRPQQFVGPGQVQTSRSNHRQGNVLDSSELRKEVIDLENDSDLEPAV